LLLHHLVAGKSWNPMDFRF